MVRLHVIRQENSIKLSIPYVIMAGIVEIYSAQIRQLEKINYGQLLVLFSRGPIDIFQAFWML